MLLVQLCSAQEILPGLTVKNLNGKIIVSWKNGYSIPVSNINIQRSFDSLKNFTTIGSVLTPQNAENGYTDANPPYNKMYYRLSISFDGGSYVISKTARPVKEARVSDNTGENNFRYPWQVEYVPPKEVMVKNDPVKEPVIENNAKLHVKVKNAATKNEQVKNGIRLPGIVKPSLDSTIKIPDIEIDPELIPYPSQRIFTAKDNNIVIHLPQVALKKYIAKFFDEANNYLFELNKLTEEYLIVEKVNFVHSGWFHFEIYENGKLIEKNKFFISKDGKKSATN